MQAAQDTFVSSSYWTESVGPVAALATIRKMMRVDVPGHVAHIGQAVQQGIRQLAVRHEVPVEPRGYPAMTTFHFDHPQSAALQTLWTVRMLERGFLASGGFYPMLAHQEEHVHAYLEASGTTFEELGQAIRQDDIEGRIGGPVKHTGLQRLT